MASSLCRSSSLINIFVQHVTVLDVVEIRSEKGRASEWNYVMWVTWSDMREHKVYRSYSDIHTLCNFVYKIVSSEKRLKSKYLKDLPKVPVRGFFDWNTMKFMKKNRQNFDLFLNKILHFPPHVSRQPEILDYFELRITDNDNHVVCDIGEDIGDPETLQVTVIKNCGSSIIESSNLKVRSTICDEVVAEDRDSDNNIIIKPSDQAKNGHIISRKPPDFLPVIPCFTQECDLPNVNEDDICSLADFDEFEPNAYPKIDKGVLCFKDEIFLNSQQSLNNDDWIRECEEIISPYSPNKAYFKLVHNCFEYNEL